MNKKIKLFLVLTFPIFILFLLFLIAYSSDKEIDKNNKTHIFVTYQSACIDRCASAWFIKKFIDPKAQFKFIPLNTTIKEGIPFDVPGAKYSSYRGSTTFGTLVNLYANNDLALKEIAKITNSSENWWSPKEILEAPGVDAIIKGLNLICANDNETVEKSMIIFDALYAYEKDKIKFEKTERND